MIIAEKPPESWPQSIRAINGLPASESAAIYRTLIADWVYPTYNIDRNTLCQNGKPVVMLRCPEHSRAMEMGVFHQPDAQDPMLYINMIDTFNHQLQVLLVVFNDPVSQRFDVDVDANGELTQLGTGKRNIEAELQAMHAGLAPGQIRAGLRSFKTMVPLFEQFVKNMGHEMYLIEPFAYHNAILFERYGFNYMLGRKLMHDIDSALRPGGDLMPLLNESSSFRYGDAWRSVRGRSWAIHDGILGQPFTGVQMYKRIGADAGINTCVDVQW